MTTGLQFDPEEALADLARRDPRVARLVEVAGPYTVRPPEQMTTFRALARSIVYQQLSGKAASTIHGRFVDAFTRAGEQYPRPEAVLCAAPQDLRACGISTNKQRALHDLASRVASGEVPELDELATLDDTQVVATLTTVRGVGVWTAEMILLFTLGRPDVLPVGDLGVRKGYERLYRPRGDTVASLTRHANRAWRGWRSVGSWYMWRALEIDDDQAAYVRG